MGAARAAARHSGAGDLAAMSISVRLGRGGRSEFAFRRAKSRKSTKRCAQATKSAAIRASWSSPPTMTDDTAAVALTLAAAAAATAARAADRRRPQAPDAVGDRRRSKRRRAGRRRRRPPRALRSRSSATATPTSICLPFVSPNSRRDRRIRDADIKGAFDADQTFRHGDRRRDGLRPRSERALLCRPGRPYRAGRQGRRARRTTPSTCSSRGWAPMREKSVGAVLTGGEAA